MSVLVQVLLRDIILGNLPRSHFALVGVGRVLDAVDDTCLERLPLLDQLLDALGIGELSSGQPFRIAGLTGRLGAEPTPIRRAGDT